jgi:hypothetical protein
VLLAPYLTALLAEELVTDVNYARFRDDSPSS